MNDIEIYQNRIRGAYDRVVRQQGKRRGAWVKLSDLRPEVGGHRRLVDAALVQLNRAADVNVIPESDQKTLTRADWDAAVSIGNQAKHLITIR